MKSMRLSDYERLVLEYIDKYPGRNSVTYITTIAHINNPWEEYKERLRIQNTIKNLLKSDLLIQKEITNKDNTRLEYKIYPNTDPMPNGLWLVNPKTGEGIRPLTIIDDAIGRYKKLGFNQYIKLPTGIFEVVDGFEYFSKTYKHDYANKSRTSSRTRLQSQSKSRKSSNQRASRRFARRRTAR